MRVNTSDYRQIKLQIKEFILDIEGVPKLMEKILKVDS